MNIKTINSTANPSIKALKTLALKKYRRQSGLFLAEGLKLVLSGLQQGWEISTLLFANAQAKNANLLNQTISKSLEQGAQIIQTSEVILGNICRRDNPQMVLASFKQRLHSLAKFQAKANETYLALDRIRDAGNLGTIIRTCDATGIKKLILIGETTDPFSVEAVRATMGSIFAIELYKASEEEFINFTRKNKFHTIGTYLTAQTDYRKLDYNNKINLLLMGNESQGLSENLAKSCQHLVKIPQSGMADSLNLSIATALMLYEIKRDVL
ncbi:MAG: RNA methyltransferase [Alphaproteobacteria bacterium]|nr:RNA methyltransferase [Alphaproteobacteria bacterium]